MLVAKKKDGTVVKEGDVIKSFRGEKAIFNGASRANEFVKGGRRSGKVVVTWKKDGFRAEYYDNVFDLTVYEG